MSTAQNFDTSPAWTGGYDLDALERMVGGERGNELRPHLQQIQVPALVLQGRYDWVTPMAGAQEMAQQIPHAQLHIFEHSGHMVFMEEQEELVSAIKQWIETL